MFEAIKECIAFAELRYTGEAVPVAHKEIAAAEEVVRAARVVIAEPFPRAGFDALKAALDKLPE